VIVEDLATKLEALRLYPLSQILDALREQRGTFDYDHCIKKQNRQKADPGVVIKRRLWPKVVYDWLFARQNGLCKRCGKPLDMPTTLNALDHIVPLARGGKDKKPNLCLLHGRTTEDHDNCNASKGANDIQTESKKTGQGFREILNRGGQMTGEENEV
jgi:hypothetical protein